MGVCGEQKWGDVWWKGGVGVEMWVRRGGREGEDGESIEKVSGEWCVGRVSRMWSVERVGSVWSVERVSREGQ